MKLIRIIKRMGRDIRQYRWAILSLVIYYAAATAAFDSFCPMTLLTGLPCPGCGTTRAVFYLLTGRWRLSFQYHPLAIGWVLLGIWFLVRRYFMGRPVTGGIPYAVLLMALMLPVYIGRMAFLFPEIEPMVYRSDNLISELLKNIRTIRSVCL